MYLYFNNSRGEYIMVSKDVASVEDAMHLIKEDSHKRNPYFKIFYYRIQDLPDGYWFDVGSWSEFYYLVESPIENKQEYRKEE